MMMMLLLLAHSFAYFLLDPWVIAEFIEIFNFQFSRASLEVQQMAAERDAHRRLAWFLVALE